MAAPLLLAACSEPIVPACRRIELGSMGFDNSWRLLVAKEAAPTVEGTAERLDVAITIVPPVTGPVTLVRKGDSGAADLRLPLTISTVIGISTRCALGAGPTSSTCGGTLDGKAVSMAGEWTIEANGNRLVEAGLAVRDCR